MTFQELDTVALTADQPALGLRHGDIGTIVGVHTGGAAFEVEFVTAAGETQAVATLAASQIRPIGRGDLLAVRRVARDGDRPLPAT